MAMGRRGSPGFSLVEILIIVSILLILAAVAIPVYLNQRVRAQNSSAQIRVATLRKIVVLGLDTKNLSGADGVPNGTIDAGEYAATVKNGAVVYADMASRQYCISLTSGSGQIYAAVNTVADVYGATTHCTGYASVPAAGVTPAS